MAYLRVEGNASSRHPFYGVGGEKGEAQVVTTFGQDAGGDHRLRVDVASPTAPGSKYRTPDEVQKAADERAAGSVRIPIAEFENTIAMCRRGRAMLEKIVQDNPEVRKTYGPYVAQFDQTATALSKQISQTRDFAPGAVVLPAPLWDGIRGLVSEVCGLAKVAWEQTKPVRVVMQNGQSKEEAALRGITVESTR